MLNENETLKQRFSKSDFLLYSWFRTNRRALYKQAILDQFPRYTEEVAEINRIFPGAYVTCGPKKVDLMMLKPFVCPDALEIVREYLSVPRQVLNAIEKLPVYKAKRHRRALLIIELFDLLVTTILDGKSEVKCAYHKGGTETSCLYVAYLFSSTKATAILKNVIRVLGRKKHAFLRIQRCTTTTSCMRITRFSP